MPKQVAKKTASVSDVQASTKKAAPAAPKNQARSIAIESHAVAEDERLAALDVIEAETKSDGTVTGLKPRTKYRFVEVDADSNIEPINAAELAGGKIRKGVLITKIINTEED